MTSSQQSAAEKAKNKTRSIIRDSGIEDWIKNNHTISYLKLKFELEILMERTFECEFLNSEILEEIDNLYAEDYFLREKLIRLESENPRKNTFLRGYYGDVFLDIIESIAKLSKFIFRLGLSLFQIITIYTLISLPIEYMAGTKVASIMISIFFGCSLTYFSSKVVQSYSSFYWSEKRNGVKNSKSLLVFSCLSLIIVTLESLIGAYGVSYLIATGRPELSLFVPIKEFLFFPPILFSIINISYSFIEEMVQHEKIKQSTSILEIECKIRSTPELIRHLENRIDSNKHAIEIYQKKYDKILNDANGLFADLSSKSNSIELLHNLDDEHLTISVNLNGMDINSLSKLTEVELPIVIESNDDPLKQIGQAIKNLIPAKIHTKGELHSELTTYQAADILNVSHQYIIRLIENGEIQSKESGSQRKISRDNLLAYKKESDRRSFQALAELANEAQELDMGY
jgi:excisionase family DNA binding protein